MTRVTIKDIARHADVSVATVSYVINKTRYVSPELTSRVQRAIEELKYSPDDVARSLRNKRTSTIGLIVPDNSNPFFAEIAKGVEDAGFDAGYSVILCNSNAMLERELTYIDVLLSKRVDGLIFATTGSELQQVKPFVDQSIPVAVLFRDSHGLEIDTFRIDNFSAGYEATNHLISLGHKRIACIRTASEKTPSYNRFLGYRKAMEDAGLMIDECLTPQGDNRISGGSSAARALLDSCRKFTAIFAGNDAMAIGAMRTLRDAGLRVPEDFSIIGLDDIILASYSEPPLTTIYQPKQETGKLATQYIIERIEGKFEGKARDLILETRLVVRNSTGPCNDVSL